MKSNNSNKSNLSNNSNKSNLVSNSVIYKKSIPELPLDPKVTVTLVTFVMNPTTREEKIECLLYVEPNKTIKAIAEALKDDENSIKTTIQQKASDKFKVVEKEGHANIYALYPERIEEIDFKIEQYKKKQENEKQAEKEIKLKKKKEEEIIEDLKKLIQDKKIYSREENKVLIDLNKLREEDPGMFIQLEEEPEKIIQLIELASGDLLQGCKIRYVNWDNVIQKKTIENLRAIDVDKILILEVKSSSISDVRPMVIDASFECPACGTIIKKFQNEKKFEEPKRCSCGRKGNFRLINKSMIDAVRVILNDLPEKSKSPSLKKINGFAREDLVSEDEITKLDPGNDIKVLGILKEVPIQLPTGSISTRFDFAFEIISIELFEPELNLNNFSEDELKKFKDLSININEKGFEPIRDSIVPDCFGYDEIKDSIVIQASQPRNNPKSIKKIRHKSNILIIGDPGINKTGFLNFIMQITPNSMDCSGSGSSEVGLTASVEKLDDFGWTSKAGVLCIAKEIACIDEINLINDDDKPKLQEALNEMKVRLNKASVHTSLPVTCGVFACANPIYGRFQPGQSIIKQFNLYPPIMNRFDFIFPIQDVINTENDKNISKKMMQRERGNIKPEFDINFLKKFFLFIRNQPEPTFNDTIDNMIANLYANARKSSSGEAMLNPRFVEIMQRCSKASARLRMSKAVEKKDIERIFEVIKKTHYELEPNIKIDSEELGI